MRLTLHTDYGFRLMIYLALHTDRLVSAREVADTYGLPHNHLTKIALRLNQGGLIESVRGRGGGMRLARPADTIRLREIADCLGVGDGLLTCMKTDVCAAAKLEFCCLSPHCVLKGALGSALGAFMKALDRLTLAEVITDYERKELNRAYRAHVSKALA